jgi:hypothetical protein
MKIGALAMVLGVGACVGNVGGGVGGPGPGQGVPDAGELPTSEVDAGDKPLTPPECPVAGCSVGTVQISGFASQEEAQRVHDLLYALPAALTRSANFDVSRDTVSQADCPDPTRTPLADLPPHCGYAGVEVAADGRLILKLRDTPMSLMPLRLEHVLTTFAARDWFLQNEGEVMAHYYDDWNRGCFACPGDVQEECVAMDPAGYHDGIRMMRDFTSSLTASVLQERAWGQTGVRWVDQNNAQKCPATARLSWLQQRIVDDGPATHSVGTLQVEELCGAGATDVSFKLRSTGATAPAHVATVGLNSGERILHYRNEEVSPDPPVRAYFQTAGMARVVAWSGVPFSLEFVSCE